MDDYLPIINASYESVLHVSTDVSSEDQEHKSPLLDSLKKFRRDLISVETLQNFQKFKEIVLDTWKILSDMQCMDLYGFRLPSFFCSKEIHVVLDEILKPIYKGTKLVKLGDNASSVGTGESTLICGPLGVGKTTVQISLLVILTILSDVALCVYVEYKSRNNCESMLPYEAIYRHAQKAGICNSAMTADSTILGALSRSKRMVIFFSDEIQYLYQKVSDPDHHQRSLCMTIIEQIATIGKACDHIGVASGSSKNLERFALHPDQNGFAGYQTLNNSVYEPHYLLPCRNKEEFIEIWKINNGKVQDKIDDDVIIRSFHHCGGVGRLIKRENSEPLPIDEGYYLNPLFQSIVNQMILKVRCSVDLLLKPFLWDPWKAPHSLLFSSCVEIAEKLHGSKQKAIEELELLIESSLLLKLNENIELLRPGLIQSLLQQQSAVEPMNNSRFEEMAFEGTLLGWSENSKHPFPTAGHCNESAIRRMLAKDTGHDYCVEMVSNAANKSAEQFVGKWYQGVTNFDGIDGFLIQFDGSRDIFDVTISQIKTGRLDLVITKGRTSTKDTFLFFLEGMKKGYQKLVSSFRPEDAERFQLNEAVFLTTKKMSDECLKYVEEKENLKFDGKQFGFVLYDQKYILENVDLNSIVIKKLKRKLEETE